MVLQYGLMGKDAGSQILRPEFDPQTHMIKHENSQKLLGLYPHSPPKNI